MVLFVAADLVWLASTSATFAPGNFSLLGITAAVFGALYSLPYFVLYRIQGDQSRSADFLRKLSRRASQFFSAVVFTVAFGLAGCAFTYLAAATGWPLQDPALAAMDERLGFDWVALLAFCNASPTLSLVLVAAYHSATTQLACLYALLALTGRSAQLAEFITLFVITFVAVVVIAAFVPAAGAYHHYQPTEEMFSNFSAQAGMWHYDVLQTLRSQAVPELNLSQVKGLVTFPSFHTALAIITAYAARGIRYVTAPVAVLNGLVVLSTLPEGGHYLVDVIAGALIAILAIAFVRLRRSKVARPAIAAAETSP
jgi:membrane-associated phospholipid phosphatase